MAFQLLCAYGQVLPELGDRVRVEIASEQTALLGGDPQLDPVSNIAGDTPGRTENVMCWTWRSRQAAAFGPVGSRRLPAVVGAAFSVEVVDVVAGDPRED